MEDGNEDERLRIWLIEERPATSWRRDEIEERPAAPSWQAMCFLVIIVYFRSKTVGS